MAKKTPKKDPKLATIIDVKLPVPEDVEAYCKSIHVFVNSVIVQQAQEIFTSLARFRGIPVDIDTEVQAINDPVAWGIYQDRADLREMDDRKKGTGTVKAIQEARHYYKGEMRDATTDAMLLAVTMYTNIDSSFQPKPYENLAEENFRSFSEADKGFAKPPWIEEPLPPLPRHLENNYEKRLKQLWDIMQLGGIEFAQKFYMEVNTAIAQLSDIMEDEETDEAKFRPEPIN